ncbi:AcrB/AcrD/AcrF family protein, partial [Lacticaseibacillus rhamnosus]
QILERLRQIEKSLPKGSRLRVLQDQSLYVRSAIHSVQEHLVVGSLLAALVVLLFLANFRSTLIAAIAIPTSVVSTFALMAAMGLHQLGGEVEVVHRPCDVEVAVGIEAVDECRALMAEVALHLKVGVEAERLGGAVLQVAAELAPQFPVVIRHDGIMAEPLLRLHHQFGMRGAQRFGAFRHTALQLAARQFLLLQALQRQAAAMQEERGEAEDRRNDRQRRELRGTDGLA